MSGREDLIIVDDEVLKYCEQIDSELQGINDRLVAYLSVLNNVAKIAATDGAFSDSLKEFISYARLLRNQTIVIGQKTKDISKKYLEAIDKDGKYKE